MEPNTPLPESPMTAPVKADLYPALVLPHIANPSRLYAFPIFGGLVKLIMLIPVGIAFIVYVTVCSILELINSFVVLFQGKYWDPSYTYTLGFIRYTAKIRFFMSGLTNKYPGFSMDINDNFSVDMPKPEHPSRFFAIPIIGGIVRFILLIPYFIYEGVIKSAAELGTLASSIPVFFVGRYPESTYELTRDYQRVNMATYAYFGGLSDTYPSFWISMNHKAIKITLIVLAILLSLLDVVSEFSDTTERETRSSIQQEDSAPPQDTMEMEEAPQYSSQGII